MELGISLASFTARPGAGAAQHLVTMARAAADGGLATLSLGDQHLVGAGAGYFQNTPALGRLLAEWSPTGRPAGCLFLLPMWSPVLVAEQVGTLAALHDGPFVVQTGIGGSPHQFAALGASTEHRVSVFEEGVRVVQALLAGETVSSERFGFTDVSIGLVPERPVEWWMGTANPAGLRRAARFGAAWYAFPSADSAVFDEHAAVYREACAEYGTEPRIHMRRDVMVLADGDEAERLGSGLIELGYRGQQRNQIDCGTPDQVAESLAVWAERGVDQIVTRTMGASDPTDLETVRNLAAVARLLA